jgi:hypothetical protein
MKWHPGDSAASYRSHVSCIATVDCSTHAQHSSCCTTSTRDDDDAPISSFFVGSFVGRGRDIYVKYYYLLRQSDWPMQAARTSQVDANYSVVPLYRKQKRICRGFSFTRVFLFTPEDATKNMLLHRSRHPESFYYRVPLKQHLS